MTLNECREVLKDIKQAVDKGLSAERKEALQTAIEVIKRVDEGKIETLLEKWGITKMLGFQHQLAIAIAKYLRGEK